MKVYAPILFYVQTNPSWVYGAAMYLRLLKSASTFQMNLNRNGFSANPKNILLDICLMKSRVSENIKS